MKKLFLLFALFAITLSAQTYQKRFIDLNFGTLANSVSETQYVDLGDWSRIDSISVAAYGTGELDVDSVDIYVGYGKGYFGSTCYTFETASSYLNFADGIKGWENLLVSGATSLTGAVLRGVKALRVTTRGATSGNDATDPNNFHVLFHIWGTK
jgi:hypothetical protein